MNRLYLILDGLGRVDYICSDEPSIEDRIALKHGSNCVWMEIKNSKENKEKLKGLSEQIS